MTTTSELPTELSDLLELAVNDARKCAKDPRYVLDMRSWHKPLMGGAACRVCMAGAVMAQDLGVSPDEYMTPDGVAWTRELFAIDNMREGFFERAAWYMGLGMPASIFAKARRCLKGPLKDDRYPWSQYLKAAAVLRKEGW